MDSFVLVPAPVATPAVPRRRRLAKTSLRRDQVWACGGGGQSAAIAALIVQGKLPKPDYAVMVDTGREKSSTWAYAEAVLIPNLREAGVVLHQVRKDEFATVDLWSGEDGRLTVLPVFTTQSGEKGKLTNYCSGEWKRDVILRWLRSQGVQQCDCWIGISVDEMSRMRFSRVAWARNVYPLVDPAFGLFYRRAECVLEAERVGWPKAPRSACWMCSNQSDAEWLEMKTNHPADFAAAVALDYLLRETDPHAWLHESCRPLDQVDFTAQQSLGLEVAGCASGMCFV